jgi:hypothetical protein
MEDFRLFRKEFSLPIVLTLFVVSTVKYFVLLVFVNAVAMLLTKLVDLAFIVASVCRVNPFS